MIYRFILLAIAFVVFTTQISAIEINERKKQITVSEKIDLDSGLDYSDIYPDLEYLVIFPEQYRPSVYKNVIEDLGLSQNPKLKRILFDANNFENVLLYSYLPNLEFLSGFPTFDQSADWSSLPTFSKLQELLLMDTQNTNVDSLFENIGASTSLKRVRLFFENFACFAKNSEGNFKPSLTLRSSLKNQILSFKNLDELEIIIIADGATADELKDFDELNRDFKMINPNTKVIIGVSPTEINAPGGG